MASLVMYISSYPASPRRITVNYYSLHTQHIHDQGFVFHLSAEDEVERERRERRERREKNLTEEEVCLKYRSI